MLDSFFVLLQNLPFGLLLAALLLDAFIVSKNRREVEPAVLWLLFCSICASGVVVVVTLGMFFFKGDTSRLHDGGWGLAVAAIASMAWYFKRQARNRGIQRISQDRSIIDIGVIRHRPHDRGILIACIGIRHCNRRVIRARQGDGER